MKRKLEFGPEGSRLEATNDEINEHQNVQLFVPYFDPCSKRPKLTMNVVRSKSYISSSLPKDKSENKATTVNLYQEIPDFEVSLDDFEEYALDRLKVGHGSSSEEEKGFHHSISERDSTLTHSFAFSFPY